MDIDLLSRLPGGADLITWFDGKVPSFHDAEILEVLLDRINTSARVKVHGFEITPDLNEKGFYVSAKHLIMTFELDQISKLELTDFNHQNVIDGIELTYADGKYVFDLKPCYGLWGVIEAASVQISVEPGCPKQSIYGAGPDAGEPHNE